MARDDLGGAKTFQSRWRPLHVQLVECSIAGPTPRVKQDHIVIALKRVLASRPFPVMPPDLIDEVVGPKYSVHQEFQIVACGRGTVKVNGFFLGENSSQFQQAWGHH